MVLCYLFPKQCFFAKNFQKLWYLAILARRFTIYKGNVIHYKYFSSYEMNIKLQNLASDFTARFVMDSSGKLEYWTWDVKGMNLVAAPIFF